MKEYQRRNRTGFFGALICILISNALAVVLQFFKGDVLDHAIAGEIHATITCGSLLITFILGECLFYYLYRRCTAHFIVGCTKLLKRDIFESILRRDFVSYKARQQGAYMAKLTNDVDTIRERRFRMLPMLFDILFKITFVSSALFLLDWRLALITIALLTTPLYIPKLIERRLQRAQAEYLEAVEQTLSKVNDWLSGFEIIKNYSIERQILNRFDEANHLSMEKLLLDSLLGATAQLITTLISYLSYFMVLISATWLVLRGEFSAGEFFVAIGMIDQLSYPLISLAEIIRQLVAIQPACQDMEKFIAEGKGNTEERSLKAVRRGIRYRDVSFGYPNGEPVLRKFSFSAEAGKRYLIQGPSGCGKTTAVNLLLRYFDADEGIIEIDDTPIQEYTSTYDFMTVVRQEAVLFHDTLRNNLTMYRDVPDEKLTDLLRDLGLFKFATREALDAVVSEDGSNLSGGEKKRICLARALLRDTDVLILDEPLANLDEGTAGKVEDLLLSIKGRLMLVVSHQFTEEKVPLFDGVVVLGRLHV